MNRLRSLRSAATALVALAFVSSIALAAVAFHDLTGTWDFEVVTENGTGTPTVRLKQEGLEDHRHLRVAHDGRARAPAP